MSRGERPAPRLGEPIEVPWWAPIAMLPPLGVLAGVLVAGPVDGRVIGGAGSLGMLAAILRVATRVRSRNLQSVFLSAAYAFWFFTALIWAVESRLWPFTARP